MTTEIIQRALEAITSALDDQLQAVYLFGSAERTYFRPGRSDVNLLLLINPAADLHEIRQAFLPLWPEYRDHLRNAPIVASQDSLLRHLHLFPDFAAHFQQHARLCHGEPLSLDVPVDEEARVARLTTEALRASAALLPELMPAELAEPAARHLHRLARHLSEEPLDDDLKPAQLFALVQTELRERIRALNNGPAPEPLITSSTDPNLCGLYYETSRAVFIIPELTAPLLEQISWRRLRDTLPIRFQSIGVATAGQLRLSVGRDDPLDLVLERYEHVWGEDPLDGLEVSRKTIYQALARLASRLLIFDLTQTYLIARDDDDIHRVVHDLQNRILNLHLQVELLRRLQGFPFAAPSLSLPGRGTPLPTRIDAIARRLDWWADYYATAVRDYAD